MTTGSRAAAEAVTERVDVEVRGGTMQDVISARIVEHGVLDVVDSDGTRHLMSPHYWLRVITVQSSWH